MSGTTSVVESPIDIEAIQAELAEVDRFDSSLRLRVRKILIPYDPAWFEESTEREMTEDDPLCLPPMLIKVRERLKKTCMSWMANEAIQELYLEIIQLISDGTLNETIKAESELDWELQLYVRAYWKANKLFTKKNKGDNLRPVPYHVAENYYRRVDSSDGEVEYTQVWTDRDDGTDRRTRSWEITVRNEDRIILRDLVRKIRAYVYEKDHQGADLLYRNYVHGVSQDDLAKQTGIPKRTFEYRLGKVREMAWKWLTTEYGEDGKPQGGCVELLDQAKMVGIWGAMYKVLIIRQMLKTQTKRPKHVPTDRNGWIGGQRVVMERRPKLPVIVTATRIYYEEDVAGVSGF